MKTIKNLSQNGGLGLGVDFNLSLQSSFISERGTNLIHFIAVKCPCSGQDPYATQVSDASQTRGDPYCRQCKGIGWLYRDPALITGMVSGIRQQKNLIDLGIASPGDSLFSPLIDYQNSRPVSSYDALVATWPQVVDDGQVIVRGAATSDTNSNLASGLSDNQDRLWFLPDSGIYCEDENGVVYTAGDYTLGPQKTINWVGNKPDVGVKYSFKYKAYFEWIAFNIPQDRYDKVNIELGQSCLLQKRHIAMPASSIYPLNDEYNLLDVLKGC